MNSGLPEQKLCQLLSVFKVLKNSIKTIVYMGNIFVCIAHETGASRGNETARSLCVFNFTRIKKADIPVGLFNPGNLILAL